VSAGRARRLRGQRGQSASPPRSARAERVASEVSAVRARGWHVFPPLCSALLTPTTGGEAVTPLSRGSGNGALLKEHLSFLRPGFLRW
ncbi:hypothetical protein KUCAC02_032390, partial [Chaenocephalus aceratus]